jgi:hypothetical protein
MVTLGPLSKSGFDHSVPFTGMEYNLFGFMIMNIPVLTFADCLSVYLNQ